MATRKFEVEVEVPEGLTAGDKFLLNVEVPAQERKPRGQLAGLAVEQMTDDQLKREIINAGSVLYKAKQRGANPEIIAANQTRLDAAKAEKDRRTPRVATEAPQVEGALADAEPDAQTAEEI